MASNQRHFPPAKAAENAFCRRETAQTGFTASRGPSTSDRRKSAFPKHARGKKLRSVWLCSRLLKPPARSFSKYPAGPHRPPSHPVWWSDRRARQCRPGVLPIQHGQPANLQTAHVFRGGFGFLILEYILDSGGHDFAHVAFVPRLCPWPRCETQYRDP